MQNNNKNIFDNLVSRTKVYLALILLLLIVLCFENIKLIIPSIIIFIGVVLYTYLINNKRKSEISETLQDLTLSVDSTAKTSLINSPFPLIILETDGNIIWKSSKFVSEFANVEMENIINELTFDLNEEVSKQKEKKNQKDTNIIREFKVENRTYQLVGRFVNSKRHNRNKKDEYMAIVYFIDQTESIKLKKEYNDSKSCVGIIMIDNYEENMQMLETEERTRYIAEIDKNIYDWVNDSNGVLIKSDRDRYVYVFEQRYLDRIKEDKFSILDKIKEIDPKQRVQFTLSIAISNEGENDRDKYKSAQTAMDIVLGRGGDQAVIRQDDIYKFYGGRTQEVEKRTKVKARVVAHALENLIKEAKSLASMGVKELILIAQDITRYGIDLYGEYRLVRLIQELSKIK